MTAEQYDATANFLRTRARTREAARMVLVDGATRTAAAEACGITRQACSYTVKRILAAHNAILEAYLAILDGGSVEFRIHDRTKT
ncbi:MAG: TrfB-related DNA-binding protein [Candidatus Paceibacterota bacterium]